MTKKYSRQEDVVARSVAGAHLLVPVHGCTRSIYTLNSVGRQLWNLLELPRTEQDLTGILVKQYCIPCETACRDVRRFLDDMVRMSLVIENK